MSLVYNVNYSLSLLTAFSIVFVILFGLYSLLRKKIKIEKIEEFRTFLQKNSLKLVFVVSIVATAGSLFFSEIAGYNPCNLCWYQRIFMYPIPIIALTGILKKQKPFLYIIPLAMIGLSISAYHNITRMSSQNYDSNFCEIGSVSCLVDYFIYFDFVTIPLMALAAFTLILMLSSLGMKK
ncbi:MAG: disulfide bond formation protein B [Candidatus Aenigmarchaeota archaeon]|nr:disulfide bond formation protein B [Candidatus Aenigmarchaeota archaeon]